MPTPEREVRPQPPQVQPSSGSAASVSAVSMKDLLGSCAAATAVSTPPREKRDEDAPGTQAQVQPPARRDAA